MGKIEQVRKSCDRQPSSEIPAGAQQASDREGNRNKDMDRLT